MNAHLSSNKDRALSFMRMLTAHRVREAYEAHVSPDFRHHNAYFAGDRQSLLLAMEDAHQKNPNMTLDVKHALEEGDFVAVHSHVRQNADDRGAAVVHLFRFQDELIIELWDVGQPIPENNPNENGMF